MGSATSLCHIVQSDAAVDRVADFFREQATAHGEPDEYFFRFRNRFAELGGEIVNHQRVDGVIDTFLYLGIVDAFRKVFRLMQAEFFLEETDKIGSLPEVL